jgi:pentapeptide MXKDX repeat protein
MRRGGRSFDVSRHRRNIFSNKEVDMKLLITATLATTLAFSGSMAFAQASDAMSHDSMAKDSMSKDSMSKDAMSHDSMKKDNKNEEARRNGPPSIGRDGTVSI